MSGVDQKLSGTAVKSVGERNIPWSQQVDEASYENLSSPANDDNSGNSSSMQFQFPPFNVKENNHSSLTNTGKGRKSSHNNDTKQKYGNPGSYNNPKRENHHINNAWNSRRFFTENSAPSNRVNDNDDGQSSKLEKRSNESVDEVNKSHAAIAAPKKTTWASIASQPAKLTSKTTFTTSSHKKKGPGMPPPPMVPGKHNLDVNVWDLPNSNPAPVPSPPLPIDLSSSEPNYSTAAARDEPQVPFIASGGGVGGGGGGGGGGVHQSDKDDCYGVAASNSNLCNAKPSPTGQVRKNWSAQPSVHHAEPRQGNGGGGAGGGGGGGSAPAIRRIVPAGNPMRYNERRGNFTGHRSNEFEKNMKHEYRDENNPRTAQNPSVIEEVTADPQILLDELKDKNNYNPTDIDLETAATARFFVIKSYSEDDIHRSIKYEIWCSTDHGNKRLDDAFKERYKEGGNVLLFFSVNSSGHFCGMAQMMTSVDYNSTSSVWSQDKWRGKFKVKWIYVKDVPNGKLRHIRLENNENKSVTYSRDTQEVHNSKGIEVLQILHSYKHTTSIFDDFSHYEKKQEEEVSSKRPIVQIADVVSQNQAPINRHFNRQNDDRERERNVRDNRSITLNTTQKNFFSSGNNFRDRNKSGTQSGNYNNNSYNSDYRRGGGGGGFDREIIGRDDRENHFGMRHGNNRKDEHSAAASHSHSTKARLNLNKRDFNTEPINKSDVRLRTGLSASRDLPKTNNETDN